MESAQVRMERMLPELRDLEQKKTFTRSEISAIVTQRNYYEALIARPKQAECFLKYIDYEKRLEKLRRLRVGKYGEGFIHSGSVTKCSLSEHRLVLTLKKMFWSELKSVILDAGHSRGLRTLSDNSIPLHILSLYSAGVRRFPESLELWRSYIAYVFTQESNKLVSRVLSAAIAAHPSCTDLWVMAAQFEADGDETGKGGGNVDGARKLLMRGLRFFKGTASIPLWVEWIRIELHFIQTIQNRRKVFGLSDSNSQLNTPTDSVQTVETPLDQAIQTAADLLHLPEEPEPATASEEMIDTQLKGQEALLSGALVKTVLQNALEAVPDLSIIEAVFPLLHAFESPLKPALMQFLYNEISKIYPN